MRGSKLPKSNPYRPAVGFRYDGLYTITNTIRQAEGPVRWHFILQRVPGQEPIRFGTDPGSRPNAAELNEHAVGSAQQQRAREEQGAAAMGDDTDDGENEENEEGQDGDGIDE